MWKGEWKAHVFLWFGLPLLGLILAAVVVVCVVRFKQPAPDAGQPVQRQAK